MGGNMWRREAKVWSWGSGRQAAFGDNGCNQSILGLHQYS